jgi:phage terminase large subunit-like protein
LHQIKQELTNNDLLKMLFPDVLYDKPETQAPRWSEDAGLVVRRKGNPKEGTIEAWGLLEGQPTGKHFQVLVYDDIVTEETIANPEITDKLIKRWELSLNLVTGKPRHRYIGTRYATSDTYHTIMQRKAAIPRIRTAIDKEGNSCFLSREELDKRRERLGSYVYSSQYLLDPKADSVRKFKEEWWQTYRRNPELRKLNIYILVDPSGKKKKTSDYTTMWVVGLGAPKVRYVLDMIHDRMSLQERTIALFHLHEKWSPIDVAYEEYGMQSDIAHMEGYMEETSYRFNITPVKGNMMKAARIERLMPSFERKEWFFPISINYTRHDGRTVDIIHEFKQNEFKAWPASRNDDGLDGLSRIMDIGARFPIASKGPKFSLPRTYTVEYDVFAEL